MRNPARIDEFCEELRKMWHKNPDQRFGQLMSNFLGYVYQETGRDIWFIEEPEMQKLLRKFPGPMGSVEESEARHEEL